jgi:hypothetical protein
MAIIKRSVIKNWYKLYHFVMASDQSNPVLIIRSPTATKEIKKFLGYSWSSSKGDEGIKLIEDANGKHITPLYDGPDRSQPSYYNRSNSEKINSYIAANFENNLSNIPDELSDVADTSHLVDLLDFSQDAFPKQISLISQKSIQVASQWPKAKLSDIAQILNGGTPDTQNPSYWDGGNICWATLVDTKQKYLLDTERKITQAALNTTTLLPINTVIFSSRATIGEVCINRVPTATNQGYKIFVCDAKKIHYEYLYHLLVFLRPILENLVPSDSKYKEINTKTISNFEIPLPPLKVQKKISKECEDLDSEIEIQQSKVQQFRKDIEVLIENIYSSNASHI